MLMVVRCDYCGAEYRLKKALFKGAKGACIRCPKCRERIVVANPGVPRVAPPIAPRVAPPAPQAPHRIASTGLPPIEQEPMPQVAVSGPPGIPGGKALRLEEYFIHPSDVEEDRDQDDDEDSTGSRSPRLSWNHPPRRPLYRRPFFVAASISLLLLAGGTFYLVYGNSGRTSSNGALPARGRSVSGDQAFDVGNTTGYWNRKGPGESFYVVKGTVTNVGTAPSAGIRIEATLLGKDNQAIMKNGSFAGNVIDESLIPHMSRVRIEGFLGMRRAEGDVNRDIPPGKTLPFMVVFTDPPEGVESFRVKAIDAGEPDRVESLDGKEAGTRVSNQQPIRWN